MRLSDELVDHMWACYREGQIARDPKQSFREALEVYTEWLLSVPVGNVYDKGGRTHFYDNGDTVASSIADLLRPVYEVNPYFEKHSFGYIRDQKEARARSMDKMVNFVKNYGVSPAEVLRAARVSPLFAKAYGGYTEETAAK